MIPGKTTTVLLSFHLLASTDEAT